MKAIVIGCIAAVFAASAAFAQAPARTPAMHNNVCLWTYRIDHTHLVDESTILFYMRGGKVWKNTLPAPCLGLKFHGFAYVTMDGSICSNEQSIFVLESHEVCMLGAFEPYSETSKEKPDHH